jgi:paraquat-inducible protein B
VVRKNTRFWNVSGARIEGGIFSGIKVTTGSIQSILRGGLAFATPDNEETGPPAQPGDHFTLHEKAMKEWMDWNPDVVLLELEESKKILEQIDKE